MKYQLRLFKKFLSVFMAAALAVGLLSAGQVSAKDKNNVQLFANDLNSNHSKYFSEQDSHIVTSSVYGDAIQSEFSFDKIDYTVNEGGAVTLTVKRTGNTSGRTTLNYATSNGAEAYDGRDYEKASGTLTFEDGEITKTITVKTIDNILYTTPSGNFFYVTLSAPSFGVIAQGTAYVTIVNDDPQPKFSFEKMNYDVNEGSTVQVTVKRTGNTSGAYNVYYETADDTAKAGSDYVSLSGWMFFNPGETTKTISIKTNADTLSNEGNETFNVILSVAGADKGFIVSGEDKTTVTISDNAPKAEFSFTSGYYTVNEGGTVTLTVKRTVNTSGRITMNYAASDGAEAHAGRDYEKTSGTLTFEDGEVTKTITVKTIDNILYTTPSSNFFYVTLSSPSLGLITGGKGKAYVTIVNDDPQPKFSFEKTNYAVNEGSTVQVTVKRTGNTSGTDLVHYQTVDDTAKAGSDYVNSSGWIFFNPGEGTKTISIKTNADTLTNEGNEIFNVILSVAGSDQGFILSGENKATVTISDNVPKAEFSFDKTTCTVNEGGTVTLTINRTGNTSGYDVVCFYTSNGTAVADSDYEGSYGWAINFPPGVTSRTITINTLADTINDEGNETFSVNLIAVSGVVASGGGKTAVTINDVPAIIQ